jgi:hypothetical protein
MDRLTGRSRKSPAKDDCQDIQRMIRGGVEVSNRAKVTIVAKRNIRLFSLVQLNNERRIGFRQSAKKAAWGCEAIVEEENNQKQKRQKRVVIDKRRDKIEGRGGEEKSRVEFKEKRGKYRED